jgi:hypothetical protein
VHCIGDDNSDTYSANYATIQAIQQQDIAYLHIQFKVSPDNALDATVGSEIISGAVGPKVGPCISPEIYSIVSSQLTTKGPEVGPYEFYRPVDAVLDFNQKAIDQTKYNAMATSLSTGKYENVSFDDVDAASYKSNSSREIMPTILDNTLARDPVLIDDIVITQDLEQRVNDTPTLMTTTLVDIELKQSDKMRRLVY